jgi:serine/threonine-protein kinase
MEEALGQVQKLLGNRYRLERELGRGGMATVYLARDETGRQVAVKVLRPELRPIVGATRFRREIEILERLRHPNIVSLQDYEDAGTRPYFVMPYVAGESLHARLARDGPLPLAMVADIARDMAAALDYAHAHGVIHRDVKPGNVLLELDRARMCDFGLARAVADAASESVSSSGLVVGTPDYMSPEQSTGGQPVGPAADVYSLGCVLYEMLTGELPFTGATAQALLAQHLSAVPRSIRVVRPDVSEAVERAVFAAMAKAPEDRPGSAGEVAARVADRG